MDTTSSSATIQANHPTYAKLFPETLSGSCSPQALESNDGPLAYLSDLYQQIHQLEPKAEQTAAVLLETRRPDLSQLTLDDQSINQTVPALSLVIDILARQAQQHVGASHPLAEAIAQARYRSQQPFHFPLQQMLAVLKQKQMPLFDLLQQMDYSYPNFSYGNLRTDSLRQVMLASSALNPALQSLLLDSTAATQDDFFLECYGVPSKTRDALVELAQVDRFIQQTGLSAADVQSLLAVSGINDSQVQANSAVTQSTRFKPTTQANPPVGLSNLYGAVFINDATEPAMSLEREQSGEGTTLKITGVSAARFDRMQKIIHLQHALQLPYAAVDLLVMSALRAEGQDKNFHITPNTLRALGVFRHLNTEYGVTAHQFSALIHSVSPYAVEGDMAFLDSVLKPAGCGEDAKTATVMVMDGAAFDPDDETKDSSGQSGKSTLVQLCQALAVDEQTGRSLLATVGEAHTLQKPIRSLPFFSALYRLTKLPRLLKLTVNEGASLIALLARQNVELLQQLAGVPSIKDGDNEVDILDALIGLVNTTQWLKRQNLSATALLFWLTPLPASAQKGLAAPTAWGTAINETGPALQAALLTENRITEALSRYPARPKNTSGGWHQILGTLLDGDGLVKQTTPLTGQTSLQARAAEVSNCLMDKLDSVETLNVSTYLDITDVLAGLIQNAQIAQEDVIKALISRAFQDRSTTTPNTLDLPTGGQTGNRSPIDGQHALLLLRWIGKSSYDFLTNTLASWKKTNPPDVHEGLFSETSFSLWYELRRHAEVVKLFNLSPAGLQMLLTHPEWIDAEDNLALPGLNLDLCYQISRYSDWLNSVRKTGNDEEDVLGYLEHTNKLGHGWTEEQAADQLGNLIGWAGEEVLCAARSLYEGQAYEVSTDTPVIGEPGTPHGKTFDDFVNSLNAEARTLYEAKGGIGYILYCYYSQESPIKWKLLNDLMQPFYTFLHDNPGPVRVTVEQFARVGSPHQYNQMIADRKKQKKAPVATLTFMDPAGRSSLPATRPTALALDNESITSIAYIISDIDYVLRLQSLSNQSGLSCQSLLRLEALNSSSSFDRYQAVSTLLFASCTEAEQTHIGNQLQESWRDALVAYLLGYWAPSDPQKMASRIADTEDLSNYFLTDVHVSSAVITSKIAHAMASLQHYLHRLFAHLEPGYNLTAMPQQANDEWHRYRNQYPLWKAWQQQMNHPENLIYPSQRPGRTQAFIELENELNQGRLTTDMVQVAVTNYLTKFEHVSNLQVVSGYLDGFDPKQDTYHFIGKTNIEPTEYYWRSLDMSLRDDKNRLSPLAWSEWEKIGLASSGQIVETPYDTGTKDANNVPVVIKNDAVRPIIIAGRPYVIWVERDRTPLPSADEKNQTPTKFRKISVFYAYKQGDGLWSPANEMMCLDGTKDGIRLPDTGNTYLKDELYQPGLIAVVDIEKDRVNDPWLAVLLYDASKPTIGTSNDDYFLEIRDLLLIDKKQLDSPLATEKKNENTLIRVLHDSYRDTGKVQHRYTGEKLAISIAHTEINTLLAEFKSCETNSLSSDPRDGPLLLDKIVDALLTKFAKKNSSTAKLHEKILQVMLNIEGRGPLSVINVRSAVFDNYERDADAIHGFFYDSLKNAMPPIVISAPSCAWLEIVTRSNGADTGLGNTIGYQNPATGLTLQLTKASSYFESIDNSKIYTARLGSTYASSVALNDQYASSKLMSINMTFPRVVINKTTPLFKRIQCEWAGHLTGLPLTVDCNIIDVPSMFNGSVQLPLTLNHSGTDPFYIGYSVTTHGEPSTSTRTMVPALTGGTGTYSIAIDAKALLENNFRLIIYKATDPSKPNDLSEACRIPLAVDINPHACEKITLKLFGRAPGQTTYQALKEQTVVANGDAMITLPDYPYAALGEYSFALVETGNPDLNGISTYTVSEMGTDAVWVAKIHRNERQAQYLDLSGLTDTGPTLPFKTLRLNTLFGKQLVARATESFDRVLAWDTQQLLEPAVEADTPDKPVDFHGANGRYFRELFLHLPALAATRLSEEQQFQDAQRWCTRYLFDPYRTLEAEQNRPPFWNTRPLAEVGTGTSTLQGFVDPAARAFTSSRFYRRAVFLFLVDHWQREGDHFFRQLTRDSLNQAWLCYQQALKLIGPLPEQSTVTCWVPTSLDNVGATYFRQPINARLIAIQKTLRSRLHNLRHALTIDGKALPFLPLYASSEDPFSYASGKPGSLTTTFNSDSLHVSPYRFRELLPRAQRAVTQLTDIGRHLMECMESEFDTTLSVLLQSQQVKLSQFTLSLQQEAVNVAKASRRTLELSRDAAMYRHDYYWGLYNESRSSYESAAIAFSGISSALEFASSPFSVAAGLIDTVPTIFGMAIGGQQSAGTVHALIAGMHAASLANKYIAERLTLEGEYDRRAQGWELEIHQASFEMQTIQQQILEQDILIKSAMIGLEEVQATRATLEETYIAMTTGFTIIPTYNWLVARLTTLYAPAYDAVLSLCLSVEAAWRYEIGDYQRGSFVRTSAWNDSFRGMLAGESLQLDLQEMETAYLQSNERRMNIRKTFSLRDRLAIKDDKAWVAKLKTLGTTPLNVELKASDFDKSYPGHYLRQLKHVSVTFKLASDTGEDLQDICAVLTQSSSSTLVSADIEGAMFLYGKGTLTPSIKSNLRAQQQIALSSTVADDGRGIGKEEWLCTLMFDDGRFLPFEGTGAISNWTLSFPDKDQVARFYSKEKDTSAQTPLVTDILIHIVYTALDGGSQFASSIKELMADLQT